jgi:IS5 family transposase
VLKEEQVPPDEKIYSIFETHTDLIKRGKVQKPIEFGHKIFLAESARGLITQYDVLQGNPSDHLQVAPSLKRHQETLVLLQLCTALTEGFSAMSTAKLAKR